MAVPTPSWISLRELLTVQGQPVTEGQAWALCYHGCLAIQRQQSPASIWAGWLMNWKQPLFRTVDDLILNEDGTVVCVSAGNDDKKNMCTEEKVIESLGVLIYKALDWSLGEEEERVLSLSLECLIQQMVLRSEDQSSVTINEILKLCQNHLQDSTAVLDFQAVNKALFAEAVELRKKLSHITSAKKTLKILLEEDSLDKASLESPCWSREWFQLMKEVRGGVRLRDTSERSYTPVPAKREPSSFMKILDDIKYKRYILHKVALINDEPRASCKAVLDLGLLRSLLKPATARKLRDVPPSSPCLHEMLMSEIQSAVKKLQPASSDGEDQSLSSPDSSVQTRLQYQDLHSDHKTAGQHQQMRRCRKPQFMDPETEEDLSGLEQNSARDGQTLDVVYKHADVSTERESTKPSSWLDVTLVRHSINKYKFQYPLQAGKPFGMGYEFVENEEFHFSSSLYVKELACVCQTIAKREVRNRKMVKDKFCFYCQREFFFTWALTCHFCKKINLFRVLYEDANPLPCMHLPVICKPLAATADAGVQVETCRCGWEKVQQWDTSDWKPKVQSQEPARLIEHC